jgi:anti-sigma28 factor (negative regulator of flagellin synthesis)
LYLSDDIYFNGDTYFNIKRKERLRLMKINGFQAQDIYNTYSKASQTANSEKAAAVATATTEKQGDKLEISEKGKAAYLHEAGNLAKKSLAPENQAQKAQKVAEIKNRVQTGNYNVSSTDVARSILKGNLFDQRA